MQSQSRGRLVLPIVVNNYGRQLELAASPSANVGATDTIRIKARQPGATAIVVRQNRRQVARLEGDEGEADVLAATLGAGRSSCKPKARGRNPLFRGRSCWRFTEPLRMPLCETASDFSDWRDCKTRGMGRFVDTEPYADTMKSCSSPDCSRVPRRLQPWA